jgi:ArsR family transcriptional regulator
MMFFTNLNRKLNKMGIIKDNHYTLEEVQFAKIGRALSHPVRKKILDQLQEQVLIRNTDLSFMFNLSVPCISEHLKKLKEANLIKESYSIHFHEIYIHPEGFLLMHEYLESLKNKFETFE